MRDHSIILLVYWPTLNAEVAGPLVIKDFRILQLVNIYFAALQVITIWYITYKCIII